MRPDLRRITFIKEEKGGYSKKFEVRDGSGRRWVVKIGKEAQAETSAIRLLWGVGYLTEVNYLVPRVTIPGKGTFTNVRFEAFLFYSLLSPRTGTNAGGNWGRELPEAGSAGSTM